jgi:hypothetical protein
LTHFFRQSNGDVGDRRLFTAVGGATGVGDITIRFKGRLASGQSNGVAVGLDVRVPTGDAMNLLGSGTTGVQPFFIWSDTFQKLAPHLNVSYTWNGSSILAGNPARGVSADFPDQLGYTGGADLGVTPRLTIVGDLLGRWVIDAERLKPDTFNALDGSTTFRSVTFDRGSFNTLSGALGMKLNVVDRLIAQFNVLFGLDDRGLHDKVTPLWGIEYTF